MGCTLWRLATQCHSVPHLGRHVPCPCLPRTSQEVVASCAPRFFHRKLSSCSLLRLCRLMDPERPCDFPPEEGPFVFEPNQFTRKQ